jgi:hypothetical protein
MKDENGVENEVAECRQKPAGERRRRIKGDKGKEGHEKTRPG